MADDAARRHDEAEALSAMFEEDFFETGLSEWVLRCAAAHAELTVQLPDDYPSSSPPVLALEAPACERVRAEEICKTFLADFNPGEEYGATLALRFFEAFQKEEGACTVEEVPAADFAGDDPAAAVAAVVQLEPGLAACKASSCLCVFSSRGIGFTDWSY